MLNFQCRQPNRATMARTLNLALLLGHSIPVAEFCEPASVLPPVK